MIYTLKTSSDAVEITHAVVAINVERARRIRHLSQTVKDLKVFSITEFDFAIKWYGGDPAAQEGESKRVINSEMIVCHSRVHWQCQERRCNDVIATESIKVKDLGK